jgi:GWxTD domain-containing protein
MESWLQTPLAGALGWTLFHFVWEALLIAVLLALTLYLIRPSSARARYALACVAMLAMPIAFGVTVARFLPGDGVSITSAGGGKGLARPIPGDTVGSEPVAPSIGERLPLAVPFWAAGVFLFYLHSLWSWLAAQRLRRTGVCVVPAPLQERMRLLADKLRVSRSVVLLESCVTDVPVVIGYFRPVILLPIGLVTGLRLEQVEAILLHELAHIRRHDYLVNLLQRCVEGLLFYHPAVWWVSQIIRTERENCCDDVVVAMQGDVHGYAEALVRLEEKRWPREIALAANGGSLVNRVRRLLTGHQAPQTAIAPVVSVALLLVLAGAGVAAWQPTPAQHQAAPVPMSEQHQRWLNHDVTYIISSGERKVFEALRSGEEREYFIEQFWLRRDPTPSTSENEFKKEHYRRMGYADKRFGAGIPGWKTDRGRTYIVYGPPDEIESHPSGSAKEDPFEIWTYRKIEGMGENVAFTFRDPTKSGEYRLVEKRNVIPRTVPSGSPKNR